MINYEINKYSRLLWPIASAVLHNVGYEQDVEDAFAAGNIKGRNTNIRRLQEEFGDGLPKGVSSVAPEQNQRRPRENSLLDAALKA